MNFVTIEEEDKIVPFFWKSKPKAQYKLPITLYNYIIFIIYLYFLQYGKNIYFCGKKSVLGLLTVYVLF